MRNIYSLFLLSSCTLPVCVVHLVTWAFSTFTRPTGTSVHINLYLFLVGHVGDAAMLARHLSASTPRSSDTPRLKVPVRALHTVVSSSPCLRSLYLSSLFTCSIYIPYLRPSYLHSPHHRSLLAPFIITYFPYVLSPLPSTSHSLRLLMVTNITAKSNRG